MALVFIELVPRAKAFARVASNDAVEQSVFAFLYGQHLLIVEWFEEIVEVGVDEAKGHAGGEEVELVDDGEVQLPWKGHEM